jgi:hypothetical protein
MDKHFRQKMKLAQQHDKKTVALGTVVTHQAWLSMLVKSWTTEALVHHAKESVWIMIFQSASFRMGVLGEECHGYLIWEITSLCQFLRDF